MSDDKNVLPARALADEPLPRRARVTHQPVLARRPRALSEAAVVDREHISVHARGKGGVVLDARAKRPGGRVTVQEEDRRELFDCLGYVDVGRGRREGNGLVEGIGEHEPGAEGFVVGCVDFEVVRLVSWRELVKRKGLENW